MLSVLYGSRHCTALDGRQEVVMKSAVWDRNTGFVLEPVDVHIQLKGTAHLVRFPSKKLP